MAEKFSTLQTVSSNDFILQKVTFIELPDAPCYAPGIAPGLFFITPKLIGCNIFVAHDVGLHKYWVIRISGKNPHKPPDLTRKPTRDKLNTVSKKCLNIAFYVFTYLLNRLRLDSSNPAKTTSIGAGQEEIRKVNRAYSNEQIRF